MATTNKGLEQPALNSTNWNTPLNANFGYIDASLGGVTTINVTGIGTTPVVLTLTQYQSLILNFTGTLTANVTYQMPSGVGGQWIVINGTTGAFTLTIDNVAAGASVVVPTGSRRTVFSDGTNVYTADNTVTSVGAAGNIATSDGTGLTGSTNFTYDGTRTTVIGTTATTASDVALLRLNSQSSGTPANGFGVSAEFLAETTPGNTETGMVIAAVTTDITAGSEDFDFVLRLMAGGAAAAEMLRVTSSGTMTLAGGTVIAGRTNVDTSVQSLAYAGISATADDDGTKSSGTYTPTPVGGNFKRIVNGGAFTLAAPTASGDYTMIIQITNNATAGVITLTGFNKTAGDPFTTTNGHDFFIFVTKCNGFTSAVTQALQ